MNIVKKEYSSGRAKQMEVWNWNGPKSIIYAHNRFNVSIVNLFHNQIIFILGSHKIPLAQSIHYIQTWNANQFSFIKMLICVYVCIHVNISISSGMEKRVKTNSLFHIHFIKNKFIARATVLVKALNALDCRNFTFRCRA